MKRTLIILLAAILAGCADAPATGPSDDFDIPDAQTTATTGAIAGVVVTEAIVPIQGATVTIMSSEKSVVTGEDGAFKFEGLDPATYFVNVEAPEYLGSQASATVVAGEVAKLRVALVNDPTPQPMHFTEAFDGYAEAWVGIAGWAYDITVGDITGVRACGSCIFQTEAPAGMSTIVMEATWTDTISPGPASAVQSGYYLTLYQGDNLYDSWYVAPGEAIHVPAAALGPETDLTVSLYPDDVWPGLQQPYELYVTLFVNGDAPQGWSFIAGDE